MIALYFGEKEDGDSLEKALSSLQALLDRIEVPTGRALLSTYFDIAHERLLNDPKWLRTYRDALTHKVSMHPFGVLPQKDSEETASELWDRVLDEYDWYREAFVALIASLVILSIPKSNVSTDGP